MARRRIYSPFDTYRPPEFHEGDRVHFRGGKNHPIDGVLVWEVVALNVEERGWGTRRGRVRVMSTRTGQTRLAQPRQLRMVESAAERVAMAVMGEGR